MNDYSDKDSRNTKSSANDLGVKYFFYYLRNNALVEVSRNTFKKCDSKFFVKNNNKYKIIGKRDMSWANLTGYLPEGLATDISTVWNGITYLVQILKVLGKLKETLKDVDLRFILEMTRLLLDVYKFLTQQTSTIDLVGLLVSIYLVSTDSVFQAESMDAIILAGLSTLLPPKLFSILQRVNMFTNAKMVDDVSSLHNFVSTIIEYFYVALEWCKVPELVINFVKELFSVLSIGKHHSLMRQMRTYNDLFKENPKAYLDVEVLTSVQDLLQKVKNCEELVEWMRRSAGVKDVYDKFVRNVKITDSNCSPSREEPVCVLFEGPAGCGKSLSMTMLIKALNVSNYSHEVKSVMDGKDFYDSYNNEFIFFLDDLGQQGNSQWRSIINMVAPVKLPLPCAEVSLKDTKFFNSKLILTTTNNFQHIQLNNNDCIADITALWRRALVVDCERMRFNNATGEFRGIASIKYFDVTTQKFEPHFPSYMKKYMLDHNIVMEPLFTFVNNNITDYLAWLCDISTICLKAKRAGFRAMQVTPLMRQEINGKRVAGDFEAEGWFFKGLATLPSEAYSEYFNSFVTYGDFVRLREEQELLANSYVRLTPKDFGWWKCLVNCTLNYLFEKAIAILNALKDPDVLAIVCALAYLAVVGAFWYSLWREDKQVNNDFSTEADFEKFKFDKEAHSSITAVSKAAKVIEFFVDGESVGINVGIFSGHYILVPRHGVPPGEFVINAYRDFDKSYTVLDHIKVVLVFESLEDDVALLALPAKFPTPFPDLSHFIRDGVQLSNPYLVCPLNYVKLSSIDASQHACSVVYKHNFKGIEVYRNSFGKEDFFYFLRGKGLCGSVIMDQDCGIVGMHVAGNASSGIGVSIKWSNKTRSCVKDLLSRDRKFILPWKESCKSLDGSSVCKIDLNMHTSVPKSSNFQPSPLYGIFPLTRQPSDLTVDGVCTVKTVAKKSFVACKGVKDEELNFGKSVLRSMLRKFKPISEVEIVKGNDWLAGLNKDSSNGLGCKGDKNDYIDFEKGVFRDDFREELNIIESSILDGSVDFSKFLWAETLKDEIRNLEKNGVPRSFRVSTIHCQVLTKKYFGAMVADIMKERDFNAIMIGCNPYMDWDKMYEVLKSCKLVFDGDVAKWDGGMVSQVQQAVKDVLLEFVEAGSLEISDFLLQNLITTLVCVMDDSYVTTHSMPSGSFLTAMFNSLVNRFYSAMWYCRNVGPSVASFWADVVDYVYGDDKLVGVRDHVQSLNALTMSDFFLSIGLGFTAADKSEIKEPGVELDKMSFLKRTFVYHPLIERVMCPLDLRTLYSGLSWVDGSKEQDIVMRDKLNCFQREIYLHPNWVELKNDFQKRLSSIQYPVTILPDSYLLAVFRDKPDLSLGWSGFKYI